MRRFARCLIVFTLALGMALPASADRWYEHYDRAEEALESEDWAGAVSELNEAIERRGDSGARVRTYGMNTVAYFPYFKLGVAYTNLNQPQAALQAFETELRLGTIQAAQDDLATLEQYQALARQALADSQRAANERRTEIIASSLADGRRLQEAGRLDDAVVAVGRALATDSDNPEALALIDELRSQIAARDLEASNSARAEELIRDARTHLDAGRLGSAASLFQEALSLAPNDETAELLRKTRERIAAAQADADQSTLITENLARARGDLQNGRLTQAMEAVQEILALEPNNVGALDLQTRVLTERDDQAKRESIIRLLNQAQQRADEGRFEESLTTANRVLALEPGNTSALQLVGRAYSAISSRLIAPGGLENLPPAVRFTDLRQDQPDGSRAQVVEDPDFVLAGIVIDRNPVEVAFSHSGDPVSGSTVHQTVGEWTITEFQLRADLDPGTTSLGLVATDDEGLTASSEYLVVYDRPLAAHPLLRPAVISGVLLLGVFLLLRRWLRRRRLLRRRFNPYVAGAPVLDETLFFGREDLIARVLQTVHNNSLLLYGERRIGKTSLQHQLKRRLEGLDDPEYVFYPVYIDLQGVPEEDFFATLAEEIFTEIGDRVALSDSQPAPLQDSEYGYRQLVADLRRIFADLQKKTERRVKLVLLMDEVDELNAYDPRINQRLRSLFMKSFSEHLVAVVSGVRIRREWDREASPWYNFFEEVEVHRISPDQARKLITQPVRGVFTFDRGVVDHLIDLTDCEPFRIQKACREIVTRLHEEGRRRVTMADVEGMLGPRDQRRSL